MTGKEFETANHYYEKIREQVRTEDNLYNQRIIWLISMQAFLFATLGLMLQVFLDAGAENDGLLLTGFIFLIPITAILVALVSRTVIGNARGALDGLEGAWNAFSEGLSEETKCKFPHPRGMGAEEPYKSLFRSGNLPNIFIFVWLGFFFFLVVERYLLFSSRLVE